MKRLITRQIGLLADSGFARTLLPLATQALGIRSMSTRARAVDQVKETTPYISPTKVPFNTIINFVPEKTVWHIERFGKYNRTVQSGLSVITPVIEKIAYVRSLKEHTIPISPQSVYTKDNVHADISGSIFYQILDPHKAAYNIHDYEGALIALAASVMRKSVGKLSLDTLFQERENLNQEIVESLRKETESWGIKLYRYEIQDIEVKNPETINSLQRQSNAERLKRAEILESEGKQTAIINNSEGKKTEVINNAMAKAQSIKLVAEAEANEILIKAKAASESIELIAKALNKEGGKEAVSQQLASDYIGKYAKMIQAANTVIVPSNPSDVSSMVTTGLSIFEQINSKNKRTPAHTEEQVSSTSFQNK